MFLNDTFNKLSLSDHSLLEETNNSLINSNSDIQSTSSSNIKLNQKPLIRPSILDPKMSQFKVEYLNCVPQFDGNPNDLNRYLNICESLINQFYDTAHPENFLNTFLLNSLIGKLTGNAKLVVNIQNVTTWQELKDTLYRNFADQRDEACLTRDLVLMKQNNNEKPNQFFDRCLQILNLLCSFIDAHEVSSDAKVLKRKLYNDLALKTFLSGLKEPLGTTIRSMRPTDLNQALQFITEEENIHYYQNFNRAPPKQSNHPSRPPNFNRPNFANQQFQMQPPYQYQKFNNFPSQPIPVRPRTDLPPQRFPRTSQVFPQTRPDPRTNVFKPNPNNPNKKFWAKPTPMSVCTSTRNIPSSSQNPRPNYFQSTGPPNFTFEELHHTETNETEDNFQDYQATAEDYDETTPPNDQLQYYDNDDNSQNFQDLPQTDEET